MKGLTKKTKTITLAALALFLVALAFAIGFWYLLSIEKQKLTDARERAMRREAEIEQYATLSQLEAATEVDRAALESYVLNEDGTTDFFSYLERTARSIGLESEITTVTEREHADPTFKTFAITLRVEGSLSGVARMTKLLETMPYHIGIERMSLDWRADEDVWTNNLSLVVTAFKNP